MKTFICKEDCTFTRLSYPGNILCQIHNCNKLFINFIAKNYPQFMRFMRDKDNIEIDDKFFLKEYYWGVAKYDPKDEFNETVGEDIAYLITKKKVYDSFNKRAKLLAKRISRELSDFEADINDYTLKRQKTFNYIEDCINERIK